ncbi:DUF2306 domain-containing protein [Catalinimonas niigatensis]|uniref:DUF2306 domain-containing protein n=1 Tax=Catalinimonas niigatensis TaxID=1397264 RepID=UPI002667033C|nr:DUF2306 domain-containing protein [Catalinimonas niigatensis]WPP48166.1 hypothetical protein PZB72_15960 [Catalinimonas niigatensis]
MHTLYHDWIGFIHLQAALIALTSGTLVLWMRKGTRKHTQVGYLYTASMLIVFITSFLIYRLWGSFGIFHIAAIIGFLTLMGGMVPVILKKPIGKWIGLHYSFMYWSVIGLYAAFVSETLTRIPDTPFYGMLGISTFGVMIAATIGFNRYQKVWKSKFMPDKKELTSH